ncbi:hypothetical protein PYCCODRAFT_1472229 [Trametes coccinea BRFM310]|uniref:Uncharacterized protein n=1 Tax=Trametes coccinea (strain BRFM310) TaxID=1353009 RepID=A0A1Y2I6Y6_TRAC3|nr:hypothetical protein PYCCODRAFT_1472229 [Trametes coccinea BRFM310]
MSSRSFTATSNRHTQQSVGRGRVGHFAASPVGQRVSSQKLTAWLICLAFLAPSVLAAPPLEAGSSPRPPVQCQSFVFTWRGGTPPFTVSVLSGDTTETPLEQHGGISSGSFQWLADVPAGASVRLEVQDSSGASVDTGPLTIQAGSDSSCLPPSGQAQPQSSSPPDAPTSSPSAIPPTSAETSVDNPATSPSPQSPTGGASPSLPQQSPTTTAAAQGTTTPATGPGTATTANPSQTTPPTTASGPSKGSAPADASNSSVAPIGSPSQLSGSEAPSASRLLSSSTLEGTRADPTASGTLLPQPTLQVSPAPPLSIGVIIGAVVGIVIILIILILVILSWRRRRPIKAADQEMAAVQPPSRPASTKFVEAVELPKKYGVSIQGSSKLLRSMSVSRRSSTTLTVRTDSTGARASLGSLVDEVPIPGSDSEVSSKPLPSSSNTSVATGPETVPAAAPFVTATDVHSTIDVLSSGPPTHPFNDNNLKCTPTEHSPSARSRGRRRRASPPLIAADGGVRLAGGPPGEAVLIPDDRSESVPYLLPPPYSRYS